MSLEPFVAMLAAVTAASFASPTIVRATPEQPPVRAATPKPAKSGHVAVNGVSYYYAVYGKGTK